LNSHGALTTRIETNFSDISRSEWNSCAHSDDGDSEDRADRKNPFISFEFLSALQNSGSAIPETGWKGAHFLISDGSKTLLAAAPCYLKTHSMGEYVFDQSWADAYTRAGGRYYPKLQISVPFTPATGRRLLVAEGDHRNEARHALIQAIKENCLNFGASSAHLTFLNESEASLLSASGFLIRTDQQFHWFNEEYEKFDDFLADLNSRKRKLINRERRESLSPGIVIERLTGKDIKEHHWDAFFSFYIDTGSRKWGMPYLTRRFFSLIGESMAEQTLLILAKREDRYIAGAINFIGENTLYGRNWGCIEDHPFLHFEVCYYQAIDFAIERGLKRIEAGAQGEHKLARGYRPVTTYSAHYIVNPEFRRAVDEYLKNERTHIASLHTELVNHAPFKKTTVEED